MTTDREPHGAPDQVLHAAGAVVWRGDPRSPEVVVVHRPRYDDWTFPKGKVKKGEHVVSAAMREVAEETGLAVRLGRPLRPVHYLRWGRLKRVDYWVAHPLGDPYDLDIFEPGDEVDDLVWLPLREAAKRLTYEWDPALLHELTALPLATNPFVFLRHATAVRRGEWPHEDSLRPPDENGRRQAAIIADALTGFFPLSLVSSPTERCVQTLEPYATRHGLEIRLEGFLREEAYDPVRTLDLTLELFDSHAPTVICGHGKVLPDLIRGVSERRHGDPVEDAELDKGAFAVLHQSDGVIVSFETHTV
ncbi:8-oxo-dGTP diphosphatase [Sinosporangium album]|uniref:8-oxo-dGTP diphosphatase n=1 Tax=Sinosporangium album TaxID=504805 RepID=A0A1G8AHL4_9ACTN|nr:NUDIX hydrolase [Sinosporangium album]SDH20343.1 8-oxo-dGTP diphosphatase [Sinosporangium album]